MSIAYNLKRSFMKRNIDKKNRLHPFDATVCEHFQLPSDADDAQNNSYYFSAHGQDGQSMFFRYAERGRAIREVWFSYFVAGKLVYSNKQDLFGKDDCPATVRCVETAKLWTLGYQGEEVDFQATFTSVRPIFDFTYDADANVMAGFLAKEKWTKSFFKGLQSNSQCHQEQHGNLQATLRYQDKTYTLDGIAIRDHSYGPRVWSYMNRHVWILALLDNGNALNASYVSYPYIHELQSGYFDQLGGDCRKVCSLTPMKELAVSGVFPFSVLLNDGTRLDVHCQKSIGIDYAFENGAYRLNEGIAEFTVDGVHGRGIVEFGFNSDSSRY